MRRVLLLSLLVCLLPAVSAQAGTVSVDTAAQTLTYQGDAAPNDVDAFVFFNERTGIYQVDVRDFDGDSTTDSPLCSVNSVDDIDCELSFPPRQLLFGGAGDDELQPAGRAQRRPEAVTGSTRSATSRPAASPTR